MDPNVVNAIKRVAHQRGVPYRWLVGAFATGIVESGLEDLSGGDADSYGFRQQRESIYGRQGLNQQINNLFDEFAQFDEGQPIGDLVADVQRPAQQYRGRYAQVLDQAQELAGGKNVELAGMSSGALAPTPSPDAPSSGSGNIFQVLANLNADRAATDPNAARMQRGWQFLNQLQSQQQQPTPMAGQGSTLAPLTTLPKAPMSGAKGEGLEELFFDPIGGWDKGQNIGPIGGHEDHVHVGANPRRLRWITDQVNKGRFGPLNIKEYEPYDRVDPVHTEGSLHYSGKAADISGPEDAEVKFTNWLRRKYGLR
jgi:hypothetical protein